MLQASAPFCGRTPELIDGTNFHRAWARRKRAGPSKNGPVFHEIYGKEFLSWEDRVSS